MLGRRPPKRAVAIELADLLTGVLPAVPAQADHLSRVDWSGTMDGNDTYGDCGPCSVANLARLVTLYLLGAQAQITLADVLDLYKRSGNPDFPQQDDGVDMQTMLEALVAGGIAGGQFKPLAFARVDHTNLAEVRAAVALFGGVLFGVNLQTAQQQQTDAGLWDYAPSGEWGGHAIVAGAYDSAATHYQADLGVVTWAMRVGVTDTFLTHQLEECWAVVFEEHLRDDAFVQGVNVAALEEAYTTLTGRPFPHVDPGPGPVPPPAPDGPDVAADQALVAAAWPWADGHHHGQTHHVAQALNVWRQARGL